MIDEYIYKSIAARNGFATVQEVALILNLNERTIQLRIKEKKYTKVRQVTSSGMGRGGKIWLIHIGDSAIPSSIQLEYYESILDIPCASRSTDGVKVPPKPVGMGPSVGNCSAEQVTLISKPCADERLTYDFAPSSYLLQAQAVLPEPASFSPLSEEAIEAEIYTAAPGHSRRKADKYLIILHACDSLHGSELRKFTSNWNHTHPEFKTSYDSILEARKKYDHEGIWGLLGKYGKTSGRTIVADDHYEYFRKAYLKEGAPSVKSCWMVTLGYARTINPELEITTFPSHASFLRRLEREIPKDGVYLARYGREAWGRKYGDFINRDYSSIKAGECLVSDHAQVDICVKLPNGKVCFPWITAWRDFKTSKWLSWLSHPEASSADHVFQSFYDAVNNYGVPSDIYIDNGKDYRCRDFAGGRRHHKVTVNEAIASPMLLQIGVKPHFALPFHGQSKTIERDFLKNKEWFSKHMPGYRGGNVKERPEKLKEEIKSGAIVTWDEYTSLMDSFIANVLNQMPSQGKVLKGLCPNELWQAENRDARRISQDALKLFCMRCSEEISIGKNGIKESSLDAYYWAEWMAGRKGTKVYLRRDPKAWQTAWVFKSSSNEYLGKAELTNTVPALARTDIEREQVKKAIVATRQREKIIKAYIEVKDAPLPSEFIAHMAAGVEATKELRGYEPVPRQRKEVNLIMPYTAMDAVLLQEEQMKAEGTYGLAMIQPCDRRSKKKIRLFECE
jgi:putative transposase